MSETVEQGPQVIRWRDDRLDLDLTEGAFVSAAAAPHHHDAWQVGLHLAGHAIVRADRRDLPLRPGDVLMMPPGVTHEVVAVPGQSCSFMQVDLPGEALAALDGPPRVLSGDEAEPAATALEALVRASADTGDPALVEEHYQELLEALLDAERPEPEALPCRARITKILAMMQANLHRPVTLEELEQLSGLRRRTLIRAFREHVGNTPYAYHLNVRVNAALRAIDRGEPIAVVAQQFGFTDQAHLTRMVRRRTGLTPRHWRDRPRHSSDGRSPTT